MQLIIYQNGCKTIGFSNGKDQSAKINSVNCNIQKKGKYHAKEYRRHRSPNRRPEGTEKTAAIAQKKREGLRSCKELIGEEVVNAFDNWTSIDLDLFAMYISEHADEIVTSCSTSETDLDDALKRNKQFAKKHKKTRKKTNDRDEPESDSDSSEQNDTQADSYAVPYGAY